MNEKGREGGGREEIIWAFLNHWLLLFQTQKGIK